MMTGRGKLLKERRNIAILGSTGSIGRSTLEVVAHLNDRLAVTYLSAHRNIEILREQVERFRPRGVVILEEEKAGDLRNMLPADVEVLTGRDGLLEIAGRKDTDILLNALVGFAGLLPTLTAIENGIDVALANKETLVAAGDLVMERVRAKGVKLLPVDSEHSAILQCLQGESIDTVRRLILTASGGPFLHTDASLLRTMLPQEALNHPTWNKRLPSILRPS
jgi:1-deoxy-D-xylulose-5-phosphate reductoisomerase